MRIFTHGKVPLNVRTSERCPFQNLHQNQTSESIGFFGIRGILKSYLADSRYQLSQGGVDPAVIAIYFHVTSLQVRKQKSSEVPFERPAIQANNSNSDGISVQY
jgi:hypothetical protein